MSNDHFPPFNLLDVLCDPQNTSGKPFPSDLGKSKSFEEESTELGEKTEAENIQHMLKDPYHFNSLHYPLFNAFNNDSVDERGSHSYSTGIKYSLSETEMNENEFLSPTITPQDLPLVDLRIVETDFLYLDQEYLDLSIKETNIPLGETHLSHNSIKTEENFQVVEYQETLKNMHNEWLEIMPLVKKMNSNNYGVILADILRNYMHGLSLEDFYICLFESAFRANDIYNGKETKKLQVGSNSHGLRLCSLITRYFRLSSSEQASISKVVNRSLLHHVSLQGFCRTFLTIKILLDSLEEVTEPLLGTSTISRIEIYQKYLTICQKLTESYNREKQIFIDEKNFQMEISHFGRTMKLIYPKLTIRRLGRRGQSLYHYAGIKWKDGFRYINTFREPSAAGPKSAKIPFQTDLKTGTQKDLSEKRTSSNEKKKQNEWDMPHMIYSTRQNLLNTSTHGPLYLRKEELSPRIWKVSPGKIPEQSDLFKTIIYRSVANLTNFELNMKPITQSLRVDIFSAGYHRYLLKQFDQIIGKLSRLQRFEKGFPHVQLIMLLLIFPLIIASDEEVARERKIELCNNLKTFTENLKTKVTFLNSREFRHLESFSYTIKRLIHISEMSMCQVKSSLVPLIKKEIFEEFQWSNKQDSNITQTYIRKERIAKAVFTAVKAFGPSVLEHSLDSCTLKSTDILTSIVTKFLDFSLLVTKDILKILVSMGMQNSKDGTCDLPSKLLLIMLPVLHENFLCTPPIFGLPFQIIKYIFHHIFKELQCTSFQNFGKRNQELSKEIFKTLWIYAMIFEEYLQALSEVIDLAESLS